MLQYNELDYQELINQSPEAINVIAHGKYIFINQKCADLVGLKSQKEMMKHNPVDFIAPLDRERFLNALKEGKQFPQNPNEQGIKKITREAKQKG